MRTFFVSTPIGAEKICLQELYFHWPRLLGKDARPLQEELPEVQIHEGGLEFQCELFVGLQLNFFLKTANRILLRLDSFRVRDLPKFYNRMLELSWNDYLIDSDIEWEISAQKSRLNNERRLEESAAAALGKRLPKGEKSARIKQKVFIRVIDDICTISLDSSGDHLHKRGWGVLKGEAPLRETLASRLLSELCGDADLTTTQKVHLLDPMMGSATFLTEARSQYFGNFSRHFSFQDWIKCPKLFRTSLWPANYKEVIPNLFLSFQGIDISEKMVQVADKNWRSLAQTLEKTHKEFLTAVDCRFDHSDALLEPVPVAGKTGSPVWVIVNPPYGERISNSSIGFEETVEKICINYNPSRLGILLPERATLKHAPQGYRQERQVKLNNGGIRCLFRVLTRV